MADILPSGPTADRSRRPAVGQRPIRLESPMTPREGVDVSIRKGILMRQRALIVLLAAVLGCLCSSTASSRGGLSAAVHDHSPIREMSASSPSSASTSSTPAGTAAARPSRSSRSRCTPTRRASSRRAAWSWSPFPCPSARPKSLAAGDSPNPYYNVYRQFMAKGGIHDEMLQIAKDNKDVVKYERIGTSTLGKPMAVLKMTANARNTPDGARPAVLFSSNNHAREWIAAEVQRRLMGWFAANKDEPGVKPTCSKRARSGSCRSRTRTATTTRSPAAPATPTTSAPPASRLQPLLAQDAARQQRQRHLRQPGRRRRPEPQLPGQARHRRGGRHQQHHRRDLPRPVRPLGAREPRVRPAAAEAPLQGQRQLPLRRAAAADAGLATSPTTRPTTRRSSTR